ncbi:MAG: DUF559 domain-containing protein [Holosporales bacterium]|jgi:very-short-patch-repair endonuclease|nr:DUF559 domain-containing protein [Holosporales bacterium]
MSRAKEQVILFHSVKAGDLSSGCLRKRLIDFFEDKNSNSVAGMSLEEIEKAARTPHRGVIKPPQPFESWFEVDVALEIMRKGYRITPQYEIAQKRIDLVVEGEGSKLAIECDGDYWHGADKYEEDMQRQRQLERCGWEFFRVASSAFYFDKEKSLKKLWPLLEERGIRQISA